MKEQLKDRKEINSHEAAAVYIETFALKVFSNADNEDRKGGSNRCGKSLYQPPNFTHRNSSASFSSTAKKFLAASNFFELLSIFDVKHLNPVRHARYMHRFDTNAINLAYSTRRKD